MKRIFFLIIFVLFLAACQGDAEDPTPTTSDDNTTSENETIAAEEEIPPTESADTESIDNAEPASQADKITIQHAVYDWDTGRYEDLIEAFEEENPDINIKLVSINEALGIGSLGGEWPDDADVRLASAADVLSTGFSAQSADQGLLLDLTPLLTGENGIDQDDFYPQVLAQSSYKGGIYSLPLDASYNFIFFDKDAFDAAGVDYPQVGWTLDDFLAAAQALTVREGNEVTQWGYVEPYPSNNFIQALAGSIYNLETEPPQIDLENTAVQEAVQWYTDLFLVHEVAPIIDTDFESGSIPEGYQMIDEGLAAMWPESSTSWGYRNQQGNVGIVPFPVSSANENTSPMFTSSILSISSGTQFPDEAWAWINFLSQQPEAIGFDFDFGSGPTTLPARRSVAEVSGFWDDVSEELGTALAFAIDHAYFTPRVSWGYGSLANAVEEILAEEKTVEEALADAQTDADTARDEALSATDENESVDVVVAAPEVDESDPNATTIEYIVGGVPDLQPVRDLAQQFEEANPGIQIEIKQPNFTSGSLSLADMATDADCFQWYPGFDDPDNLAVILSLDPFLDNDPTISKDDFFPAAMEWYTHQGQVWGLPAELNMSVIEYNKDLFDAANLPYPTSGWTTDDFLAAAVALTEGEGDSKQYGYVPAIFEAQDLLLFMDRLGAEMFDESQDPPNSSFTDPSVVEAMRWYVDLTTEYEVKPVFMTDITNSFFSFDERETLIDNDLAGMWLKESNDAFVVIGGPEEEKAEEARTGIVPLPTGPDGTQTGGYSPSAGYFISAETEARQACWDWLVFLTEQPGAGNTLPARVNVAQSDAFRDVAGDEAADAFLETVLGETRPSLTQRFSQSDSWLGINFIWLMGAYDQVLHDDVSIEDALAQAQETMDGYRDCVISNDAFSDDDAQQDCVREADPDLPDYIFGPSDDDDE